MNKRIIVLVIMIAVGLAALLFSLNRPVSTGATIDIVPGDSSLTLNDKQKIKKGTVRLEPGNHVLKAARPGFADKEVPFTVTSGQVVVVNVYLEPNSEEGRQWLKEHPNEVFKAEGFSSRGFDDDVSDAKQQNPIINHLPYIDQEFRVDYGASQKDPDNPSAVAIIVTFSSESGKQQAVEWIRFKGYDPNTLEIIYKGAPKYN